VPPPLRERCGQGAESCLVPDFDAGRYLSGNPVPVGTAQFG